MHPHRLQDRLRVVIRKMSKYRRPAIKSGSLTTLEAERAHALCQLGQAQLAAGFVNAAADVLLRAIVLDAANPVLRFWLGKALYKAGQLNRAMTWLQLLSDSGFAKANLLRGQILADLGRNSEAIEAFELALNSQPGLDEARLHLGAVLIKLGQHLKAIAELGRVLELDPVNGRGLTLRAAALVEAGNPDQALKDLAKIEPDEQTAEHVLLKARIELVIGGPDSKVDRIFNRGIEQFPTDLRVRMAFGRTLAARRGSDPLASGRAIELLLDLVDSLEADDNPRVQAEALFMLAELYSEGTDSQDQAEDFYHRGLALQPDDPGGLTGLGALLLDQGRPAHAMPWLLNSIVTDPRGPRTIEYLARTLCAIPDDEAVARWLGLITAALPQQAPTVLAHLLRFVQEAGRTEAYQEVRREGHRMKNLVAVVASRSASSDNKTMRPQLDRLYQDWSDFLTRIRQPTPAPSMLAALELVRTAISEATEEASQLTLIKPPGLPLIRGERQGLTDALANVIRNAVQAAPPNKPVRVVMRCRKGDPWLEIAVTDEGPGIGLEDRRRIFDPGYSTRQGGSGLGLSIARRVILTHGGRISISSAPGGPTTFTIRLPIAISIVPQQILTNPEVTFDSPALRPKRPKTEKTDKEVTDVPTSCS